MVRIMENVNKFSARDKNFCYLNAVRRTEVQTIEQNKEMLTIEVLVRILYALIGSYETKRSELGTSGQKNSYLRFIRVIGCVERELGGQIKYTHCIC
jgi:hypothetical protein